MRKEIAWKRVIICSVSFSFVLVIFIILIVSGSLLIKNKTNDKEEDEIDTTFELEEWINENGNNVLDDEYYIEYYAQENNIKVNDFDYVFSDKNEIVIDDINKNIDITLNNGVYDTKNLNDGITSFEILKYDLNLTLNNSTVIFTNELALEISSIDINNSIFVMYDSKKSYSITLEEKFEMQEFNINNSLISLIDNGSVNEYSSDFSSRGSLLSDDSYVDYL